jgi:hypothetical protein
MSGAVGGALSDGRPYPDMLFLFSEENVFRPDHLFFVANPTVHHEVSSQVQKYRNIVRK